MAVQRTRLGRLARAREVALGADELLVALLLTLGLVVVGVGAVNTDHEPAPSAPSGPASAVPAPSAQSAPAVPGR
ncbi:hypothetical protein [Nocardioides iriomotensis]|uniref:Uncharacterized protein n=1 Tax=Nocardioides iriomotensis TaxID=715784 RepID=A0A4Q5J641_9ACTN|nr:hypothetical protein [Nocardioides iriomotensis]RYU14092.1 hypothetical protein ETU37_04060 [Nocardioides iriomotensis]